MQLRIPRVKGVMTPFPYAIGEQALLADARAMMDEHDIRHLPVTREEALVGVLFERELSVAESHGADVAAITVGDICTKEPCVVDLNTPLGDVAKKMAARRCGAALVTRADKLVGILTSTDVCRLLGEVMATPPDDVA